MFKGRVRNDPAFLVGFIDNRHFCNYDLQQDFCLNASITLFTLQPTLGDRVYRDEDIARSRPQMPLRTRELFDP